LREPVPNIYSNIYAVFLIIDSIQWQGIAELFGIPRIVKAVGS